MIEMLTSPLMQRALIVAVLVGISAPVVGTFLVSRSMALMGDGIGHIALTGVALGWLAGTIMDISPHDSLALPGAIIMSVVGSLLIELIRARGRTGADVALAILFYGGIAGGVLLISAAGGTTTNLTSYLFGSLATVSRSDLIYTLILAVLILGTAFFLAGPLFALAHDEEYAKAAGLPVRYLNLYIAIISALTVSISMRVVGVLLVSAIMIVPVAIAQLISHSFIRTMRLAMGFSVLACIAGLIITYNIALSPGATIVIILIALYTLTSLGVLIRLKLGHSKKGENNYGTHS